jgi:hypothetical protein
MESTRANDENEKAAYKYEIEQEGTLHGRGRGIGTLGHEPPRAVAGL